MGFVWNAFDEIIDKFFVRYVQVSRDKIATTLNSTTALAYQCI